MSEAEPTSILNPPASKPAEKKEKPMSRQQRRFIQRIEVEAQQTFNSIASRFLDFFTDSDNPEGEEVVAKMNQLSAQWKVYCHRKQLNPSAYGAVESYCKGVCEQYFQAKEPQPQQ